MKRYDVIVLGAGGGTKIALPAVASGQRVALIEEDRAGGTCLNRGCIPSKMLIYPNELAMEMRRAQDIDIHLDAPPRIDFQSLIDRTTATIKDISTSLVNRFESLTGLDYYAAHADFIR